MTCDKNDVCMKKRHKACPITIGDKAWVLHTRTLNKRTEC